MIGRESLAQFAGVAQTQAKPDCGGDFDMDAYIAKHGFPVIRSKPWQSHPGGLIYELEHCPFNPEHTGGSAALTIENGKPGFRCQHDGCKGRTIKDIFAAYAPERPVREKGQSGAAEDRPRAAQSQLLVECAAQAELFHTPGGEAFASLPVGDHHEVWMLKGKGCRRWLIRAFYQKLGKPPGAQAMQDALGLLEARAQFDSPAHQVFTRFAPCGDGMYLDLCNERWEAVEITAKGWRIVQNPPVRFRRSKGMQALPYPAKGGSLSTLRGLVNVGDEKNWIMLLSWLVAACRPQGPYPILILQGEQGSAKSTTARLVRGLIDPVTAPVRTPPREERDLVIAANNAWVVAYDNMSGIQQLLSDGLCRLATGGGFSTRELYTDIDEVILDVTRPMILNGIDQIAERPDLADRATVLSLPRIDERARQEEKDLYRVYEQERPLILGALLTAISGALDRWPEIKLDCKPRMADFARWATAAEVPLGFRPGAFMDAYTGNRSESVRETLESDPIGAAILVWIADENSAYEWNGISKNLLELLGGKVDEGVKKSREWPKTPRALAARLRRLVTFLRESGVEIIFPTDNRRILTIKRMTPHSTAPTAPTCTAETAPSLNQSVKAEAALGGRTDKVVVELPTRTQPPPELPTGDRLKVNGLPQQRAVEAEGAVVCGPVLDLSEADAGMAEVEL